MSNIKNIILSLIKRNKLEIYLAASVFFVSIVIGFLILKLEPSIYNSDFSDTYIKDTGALSIIKNNLNISMSLILGNLFLGATTLIKLFYNGLLCGMMLEIHSSNLSISTIVVKTVFHGLFEIPGIIICGGIGLKTLTTCIKAINRKKIELKVQIRDSLFLFLFSTILIIIGGVIEGNIIALL